MAQVTTQIRHSDTPTKQPNHTQKQTRLSGLKLLLHRTNQTAFWQIDFIMIAGRSKMDDKGIAHTSNFANIPDQSCETNNGTLLEDSRSV